MKINDNELYIKLPIEYNKFVTLPNSFNSPYNLFDRDDIIDLDDNILQKVNYNQKVNITNFSLSSLQAISGNNALYQASVNCNSLTSVDLGNLAIIGGNGSMYYTFQNCTNLTSVDLSSLTTISGNTGMNGAFQNCTGLTSLDLGSLTTISGTNGFYYTFRYCSSLTSINLNSLRILSGNYALQGAFQDCTSLTSLSFPSLTSNSFGSYTNQFTIMLQGVTGCTVHFPVSLQSVIGNWSDVTNGFGGTNTTVLFDLNGGRMAYTSEDGETVYTADNTNVLQSPSVGDTMYTKSVSNIYSSESTLKSIEGNKIYLNDRNIQNNYNISNSVTFDLLSITSIQLSLGGRSYTSHTLVEYLDISGSVLSSYYISNAIYPISSWSSEAKYLRVSPNTSASGYTGSWRMTVTTTSYKTYPEPFKRDASKDVINYVS